jgi:hypothetical protein
MNNSVCVCGGGTKGWGQEGKAPKHMGGGAARTPVKRPLLGDFKRLCVVVQLLARHVNHALAAAHGPLVRHRARQEPRTTVVEVTVLGRRKRHLYLGCGPYHWLGSGGFRGFSRILSCQTKLFCLLYVDELGLHPKVHCRGEELAYMRVCGRGSAHCAMICRQTVGSVDMSGVCVCVCVCVVRCGVREAR